MSWVSTNPLKLVAQQQGLACASALGAHPNGWHSGRARAQRSAHSTPTLKFLFRFSSSSRMAATLPHLQRSAANGTTQRSQWHHLYCIARMWRQRGSLRSHQAPYLSMIGGSAQLCGASAERVCRTFQGTFMPQLQPPQHTPCLRNLLMGSSRTAADPAHHHHQLGAEQTVTGTTMILLHVD